MTKRLVSEHFRDDGTPKRRFDTREAAQAHLDRHCQEYLIVYRCTFCGGYHFSGRRTPRLT
jgi:hypothetical protein